MTAKKLKHESIPLYVIAVITSILFYAVVQYFYAVNLSSSYIVRLGMVSSIFSFLYLNKNITKEASLKNILLYILASLATTFFSTSLVMIIELLVRTMWITL